LQDLEPLLQSSPEAQAKAKAEREQYQFDTARYIREKLGWEPWSGDDEHPGQVQVIEAYELALRQQHERDAFEAGEKTAGELQYWQPGQTIQNWIRVEAGHTVGKTKLSSGLVNHFFDNFTPSIIYTFAPTWTQIHDLLWKEIKSDRRGKGLPGRVLDLELKVSDNHFANGKATHDAGGKGTERVQGQHGKYLMFVLDEAEGIPDFVWNAVKSMTSGGICIVLMLANPRTRTSRFHKAKSLPNVRSFRISCVHHPNVLQGREVVPGAVRRQYVQDMMQGDGDGGNCEVVSEHEPDEFTFTLPFEISIKGTICPPGTIFKPNPEFLFRVLGIAPKNLADNVFFPVGRYEAACKRGPDDVKDHDYTRVRMGVDASRYGTDYGTLYVRHRGTVYRATQFWKADTPTYVGPIREEALRIWEEAPEGEKPTGLHIRVDGSGGYGGGIVDGLKYDPELIERYPDFEVIEVQFGSSPYDETQYADQATEMYGEAAESIKGLCILNPPAALEADLCERPFEWVNLRGVAVRKLRSKEKFKQKHNRSPDDGDGFVLCVSPDHIFHRAIIADVW
jgi:hypothetical protein